MEGRDFQTPSQKDMVRGDSLCKYQMQHNPRTGKGAIHQLRVSHNCKMQIPCLPPWQVKQVSGFISSDGPLKQAFY